MFRKIRQSSQLPILNGLFLLKTRTRFYLGFVSMWLEILLEGPMQNRNKNYFFFFGAIFLVIGAIAEYPTTLRLK